MKALVILVFALIPFYISKGQSTISPVTTTSTPPRVTVLDPSKAIGKGFFTTFDTDDGLAMDIINFSDKSTICDSKGNLWFCTSGGGISRYDGKSFTNFTTEDGLINNAVRCMLEDESGLLWLGTSQGLSIYNGHVFTMPHEKALHDKLINTLFLDGKGNVWIGTANNGLYKYDGNSFIHFSTVQGLPSNAIRSVREDLNGNIWIATFGGISKYDGNNFTNFNRENGLLNDQIQSLLVDRNNNIWLGYWEGGISKINGESFSHYTSANGVSENTIYCITQQKDGTIWFGTNGDGAIKFDNNIFTTYSRENGLASNIVRSITEDKLGNLWFGTRGGGVSRFEGESFITLNKNAGLEKNIVRSITEDKKGNIWFGMNEGGFSKLNDNMLSAFTTEQGLINNSIFSLIEDFYGNIWLGTLGNGLLKYDGSSFVNITAGTPYAGEVVFSIIEDSKRNIWFSTISHGLVKYDGQSFTSFSTQDGLANNNVQRIKEDSKGNLWIGTWGGGLSKFDGSSISTYTIQQGLAYNIVLDILEDNEGNIWVGTYGGGINIIENDSPQQPDSIQFKTINKLDGLPDNHVAGLAQDSKGNIYAGTNFGLAVIPVGKLANEIEIYNQFNGYPVRDVNGGAFFCDSRDQLWIGTGSDKSALVRFDYSEVNRNTNKLNLIIEKVSISDKSLNWYSLEPQQDSLLLSQQEVRAYSEKLTIRQRDSLQQYFEGVLFDSIGSWHPIPYQLVLPYRHNAITFEFNAIETSRNYMVKYQYMLEGMEDEWHPLSGSNEAVYNNLREGHYTFMLKAQSPEGIWSDLVVYPFEVRPPWYRSWWAIVCYIVSFVAFIIIFVRFRTAALEQSKLQLEQKIRVATKEILSQKEEIESQHEEIRSQHDKLNQLNKAKDRLFSIIGHDLRGPMSSFIGFYHIFNSEYASRKDADPTLVDLSNKLKDAGDQVLSLLEHLLSWSKSEQELIMNIPEQLDAKTYINEAVSNYKHMADSKQITLSSDLPPKASAFVDKNALLLILRNLLNNAIKFTPEGGDIKIRAVQKTDTLEIKISDTGVGIPQDKIPSLFEISDTKVTYGTAREKGTGLGLSMVYSHVRINNGTIKVESDLGKGTTFIINLPSTSGVEFDTE